MANTPTTLASVASRLTDEEVSSFARFIDGCAGDNVCTDEEAKVFSKKAITEFHKFELRYRNIAAVLRDYVRLREENAQLKARLEAVVKEIESREWINDGDLADAILRLARGEGGLE